MTGEQTVLTGSQTKDLNFESLETAVTRLNEILTSGENQKLAAARVVQAIRDQQLYREIGFTTMREFFPVLLQQTASIGWYADRTVKMWVGYVDIYIDQLEINEPKALKSNSHLHALMVLGDIDRKHNQLNYDTDKEGKLGLVKFDSVTRVIVALTNANKTDKAKGLDEAATEKMLLKAQVTPEAIAHFNELAGRPARLPVGGWSVADTKAFIDKVKGVKDEPKAKQIWYLSFNDGAYVEIDRIAWELEGEEIGSVRYAGKAVSAQRFAQMSKGDKVVDISEGQDNEDDGYTSEEDD